MLTVNHYSSLRSTFASAVLVDTCSSAEYFSTIPHHVEGKICSIRRRPPAPPNGMASARKI